MFFNWLKNRRRQQILRQPIGNALPRTIAQAIRYFSGWSGTEQSKLINNLRIFVAEKTWEGCEGLRISQEMKWIVAAQAAMMLQGIDDYVFDRVKTILLYPASFRHTTRDGLTVGSSSRIGEAWHRGPIVLSWHDVVHHYPGRNVVVHELAHHLDGIDGEVSGSPSFDQIDDQRAWDRTAKETWEELRQQVDQGQATWLDDYAATNLAEFFAVVCEYFFEESVGLQQSYPQVHSLLVKLFHVDPSLWRE